MTKNNPNYVLEALQNWYASQCDGDWEHEFGIRIDNIDNPGWSVTIPLSETELEGRPFVRVQWKRSDTDWVSCQVENAIFDGSGGSRNLIDILQIFLEWANDGNASAMV